MPHTILVPRIEGHSQVVCCKNVDTVNIHTAKTYFLNKMLSFIGR